MDQIEKENAAIRGVLPLNYGREGHHKGRLGQLVNEAVSADEVVDIYKIAGLATPDLVILGDEFLDSLADKDRPTLQMGLLRRLFNDQIRTVRRTNDVHARRFSEQLDEAINRYTNRALTAAEIIVELVKLAKNMRDQNQHHEKVGLSIAEAAFYDAIVQNDAAVLIMGYDTLKKIAIDIAYQHHDSVTIHWKYKASVKPEMRAKVRRLLTKYGYPPDLEEKAVELVLQQAELFADSNAK